MPAAPPVQGMVLLRNGEVIEGRVSRDEGIYIVDLPNGRIRIRQADVDLVCSSLEEGYRRKRAVDPGGQRARPSRIGAVVHAA